MRFIVAFLTVLAGCSNAAAHPGHGLNLPHGHTSDAWGFIALFTLVVLVIWLARRSK